MPTIKEALRVHIRWMIARDLNEVTDIDWQAYPLSWLEEDFRRCLRERNCIGMVAERGEKVVGFMIYELHKHSLTLLRLAVKQDLRHRSVGTQMIAKLQGKLNPHHRSALRVAVPEENLAACLFLRSCGLWARGVKDGRIDMAYEVANVATV